MIGLIVAVVDDQHGPAGSHGLGGGADTALVDDHAGTREDCGVRGIVNGNHARWKVVLRLVARIRPTRSTARHSQTTGGIGAVLEEIASHSDRCRAQGEHDGRIAGIEKALELR